MKAVLCGLAILLCVGFVVCAPVPPVWPSTYYSTAIFSIPYFNTTETIVANYDGANNRQRFDYYSGLNSFIFDFKNQVTYSSFPRVDKMVCQKTTGGGSLVSILPDLSANWTYVGPARINGWIAENWEQRTVNFGAQGIYNMFLYRATPNSAARPLLFVMKGVDTVFDSHPDVYIIEYNAFVANWTDPTAFSVPGLCSATVAPTAHASAYANMKMGLLARMFKPAAPVQTEDERIAKLFNEHCIKYGKYYQHDTVEHKKRLGIFADNLRFIEEHNAKNTGMTLGMNHFGDMSDDEFKAIMLPKALRGSKRPTGSGSGAKMDWEVSTTTAADLPDDVDWVKKGAVTMVKDQGACGSCWTFGTTGTIEGAHYVKNHKLVSLSEQQIVDCAWGFNWGGDGGNQGCNGGFASGALQWIIDNKGIATEETYNYLMQDAFCSADMKTAAGVVVKAYVNVSSSEDALKDAVAKGPTAVAIDASHPEFRFYKSGVYYQANCKSDVDDLDHEVLAVGYGRVDNKDTWLVKNSWSTHWGMDGYVHMSRNRDNNCGIATQANYAIVA